MWQKWKSADKSDRLLILLVAAILGLWVFNSISAVPRSTGISDTATFEHKKSAASPVIDEMPPSRSSASTVSSAKENTIRSVPPTATVDGVTYSGEQQIEAMSQAARDAGMDDPTAQRLGEEAAMLCNGNTDCLR